MVQWSYLLGLMEKMGFNEKWIGWMKVCLKTVQYFVKVNGDSVRTMTPWIGLRQVEPLSPYLFILCTEGLSPLLKQFDRKGDIHGIKVCKKSLSLFHILFVDDYFFFCRATKVEINTLAYILDTYGKAYGQLINFQKL